MIGRTIHSIIIIIHTIHPPIPSTSTTIIRLHHGGTSIKPKPCPRSLGVGPRRYYKWPPPVRRSCIPLRPLPPPFPLSGIPCARQALAAVLCHHSSIVFGMPCSLVRCVASHNGRIWLCVPSGPIDHVAPLIPISWMDRVEMDQVGSFL